MSFTALTQTMTISSDLPTHFNENFRKARFQNISTQTATFTVFADDATGSPKDIYLVTTGSSAVTANLPAAGSDYTGRTVDVHIGYEGSIKKFDYYIQGGPAYTVVADVDGKEAELSGKVGGTFNVTQNLGVYGEFSGITNGDEDNSYGTKIGAKYSF